VNGADKAAAPETVANPSPAVTADAHVNGRGASKHKLFSESWAQAFQQAINASDAYRKASLNWQAGSLAFVMKAAPAQGFLDDTAVLMDLHKGVCRSAHSLPAAAALQQAAFVIEGDHRTWLRVLGGAAPPLIMLMRGDLHLKKGSLIRLLPFTQSAQELLHSAQRVPWE
jgi:putative sterol carrier protein